MAFLSPTWNLRFLGLAAHIATWSKDPSTKVGCVVAGLDKEVRSTGFNGLPRGVADTPERLSDRELKYPLIVHAEENALLHAARIGVSLRGCELFSTMPPCTRCAVSIIQAGIGSVWTPAEAEVPDRWFADAARAGAVLREAGVYYGVVRSTGAFEAFFLSGLDCDGKRLCEDFAWKGPTLGRVPVKL